MQNSRRLLERVRSRQILGSLLRRLTLCVFIFAGLYAALLLLSRLTGLIPNHFLPFTVGAPFALALIGALILARRPRLEETAHLVDARADKKDLFLTAVRIGDSMGEYQALVVAQAEREAGAVRPAHVAPLPWRRPATVTFCAAGLLLAGAFWLPQFDPFKKQEARDLQAKNLKEIEATRKTIAARSEILAKKEVNADLSEEVRKQMDQVQADLAALKPETPKENQLALNKDLRETSKDWREATEKRLKDALDRNPAGQQFGALDAKMQEMQKDLQMGKTGALEVLEKEMKEIAEMMKQMENMPANNEREQLRQQIKERLDQLAQFAQKQANNAPMNAALQQALDQLAKAADPQMMQQAMQAAQEAMQLGQQELQALAQNMRDVKGLEDAIKAIQAARQANAAGKLPGQGPGDGQGEKKMTMAEYAAMFEKLMAEQGGEGEGDGGAFGDRGHGAGGTAPENDQTVSMFKTEKEEVAFQAGKTIMEWKVQGQGPVGEADVTFLKKEVDALKQGASEAILKEQVPRGYHDAIAKYFDTLGESVEAPK